MSLIGWFRRMISPALLPSCDTTGATDTAAFNALTGGVELGPGTFYANATWKLRPGCRYDGAGRATIIKAANGTNLPAVVASAQWVDNQEEQLGASLSACVIDGNKAGNPTGGAGLVIYEYFGVYRDIEVVNAKGDGFVVSDKRANGTPTAFPGIENRIIDCRAFECDGDGFHVLRTPGSGTCTDGWMTRNASGFCGGIGFNVESSDAWFISQNHAYASGGTGFLLDFVQTTIFSENEVDGFGLAGGVGYYCGVHVLNVAVGRPGNFHHNIVFGAEADPASSYHYFDVNVAGGVTAEIGFDHNKARRESGNGAQSIGFVFTGSAGAALTVTGDGNTVQDGIAVPFWAGGGAAFTFAPAGNAW